MRYALSQMANLQRRLKAGCSHDWLPHSQVHTRYSACRRPLALLGLGFDFEGCGNRLY